MKRIRRWLLEKRFHFKIWLFGLDSSFWYVDGRKVRIDINGIKGCLKDESRETDEIAEGLELTHWGGIRSSERIEAIKKSLKKDMEKMERL